MQNNRRYDLSDRLIHFFRNIDLDVDSLDGEPGSWSEGNIAEDTKYSANFMMRCAIRSGQLWATWSVRGAVRTIYGPRPAICFTEMPTAAFLEASALRQRAGQKISTFALTFPKAEMFELGGAAGNLFAKRLDDLNAIGRGREGSVLLEGCSATE